MKKTLLFVVAMAVCTFVHAQVDVDMSNYFTITEKYVDVTAPLTVKDGIAFVGDTRKPEKIIAGKERGMRVNKARRSYEGMEGGKGSTRQYTTALSFRRAPAGATRDHAVVEGMRPRSCMLQIKPTSAGSITFAAFTNRPEAKIFIAVRNGDGFRHLSTLILAKFDAKGTKAEPFKPTKAEYTYTEGDELWIYSDGAVNLHGFRFSGTIDKTFAGTNPMAQ